MSNANEVGVHTLSLVTCDKPGVLVRISLVFARRGYNIESLSVSPGIASGFARMTITSRGATDALAQIIKQLGKLIDVIYISDHRDNPAIEAEIALIKLQCGADQRAGVLQIAEHYGAKVVDCEGTAMIVRVSGSSSDVEGCVAMLEPYDVRELVRSGPIVIDQGPSHFDALLGPDAAE